MLADCLQNINQATHRQHHGVAICEEDLFKSGPKSRRLANFIQDFVFGAGAEFLLRLSVHIAEGALIPGAAIGNLKNQ